MGIGFNNTGKFASGAGGFGGSNFNPTVNISIMGVGGAGGNIIKYLHERELANVNLICANTDVQAMMSASISSVIQLGKNTTRGLGAGSNPEVGEKSAIEAAEEIKSALHGTDMLILVAGLGGGTGTGATPVISKIAREMGILTLAFVVTPFDFEAERKVLCNGGINNLLKNTDSLITLSNQKLLSLHDDNLTFNDALIMVNDIVYQAISGVVNLLLKKELINRDFADIVQVMKNKGHSIISIGAATGDNRALRATAEALTNPLLSDVSIKGANGMVITIGASQASLKLSEVNDVMNAIVKETNANESKPTILFGTSFNEELGDELRVSIIATGLAGGNGGAGLPDDSSDDYKKIIDDFGSVFDESFESNADEDRADDVDDIANDGIKNFSGDDDATAVASSEKDAATDVGADVVAKSSSWRAEEKSFDDANFSDAISAIANDGDINFDADEARADERIILEDAAQYASVSETCDAFDDYKNSVAPRRDIVKKENNKRGFFKEFFSKNKNFDDAGNVNDAKGIARNDEGHIGFDSKSFDDFAEQFSNDGVNFSDTGVVAQNPEISDADGDGKDDIRISFLDSKGFDEDEFFSDIESFTTEEKEILKSSAGSVSDDFENVKPVENFEQVESVADADDNIVFLTGKKEPEKPAGKFYSKQVDIFELIDSITANK